MYISQKYKILYCHVPKTGGTTIYSVFNSISPEETVINKGKSSSSSKKFSYHIPLEYIELRARKEINIDCSNYTKVISIRNPWGRLWSHWKDYIVDNTPRVGFRKMLSFKEFLFKRLINVKSIEYMEQRSILFYFDLNNPPHFIRYWNLEEDLRNFVKTYFNFDLKEIPHKNNKKNIFNDSMMRKILWKDRHIKAKYFENKDLIPTYKDVYDDDMKKLTNDYFKNEIEYFKYEF